MDFSKLTTPREAVKWLRDQVKPLTTIAINKHAVIKTNVETAVTTSYGVKAGLENYIGFIPVVFTFIALISILVVTGYILWHVFFKKTIPGIEGARKAYSIFHLITSCIIVILIIVFATPFDSKEQSGSKINPVFSSFNSFISIAFVPVMLLETILTVLSVFIISVMFVITSSLLRTYYAIQCPIEQTIELNWWGKIIDVIMFSLLGIFFCCILVTQLVYAIVKKSGINIVIELTRTIVALSRRLFVMTATYYILYLLFSGIEYLISSNITAIHNWKKEDPTVVCVDELSGAPKSVDNKLTAEFFVKILYLIFNIVLCIVIWITIILLMYGHFSLGGMIPKIVKVIGIVMTGLMYLLGGNISEETLKQVINQFMNKLKSVVPSNMDMNIDIDSFINKTLAELKQNGPVYTNNYAAAARVDGKMGIAITAEDDAHDAAAETAAAEMAETAETAETVETAETATTDKATSYADNYAQDVADVKEKVATDVKVATDMRKAVDATTTKKSIFNIKGK